MTIWGAVVSGSKNVTIYSFVSIRPAAWKNIVGLTINYPGRHDSSALAAPLSHTDFNFDPWVALRDRIFDGQVKVRCKLAAGCPNGVPTLREPADGAANDDPLTEGALVTIIDMTENGYIFDVLMDERAT